MTANVLELCLVRFETFSYRNITDKDTMFVAICKAKIIVPAKRPLLQMLCCPPALGKGAVSSRRFILRLEKISFRSALDSVHFVALLEQFHLNGMINELLVLELFSTFVQCLSVQLSFWLIPF